MRHYVIGDVHGCLFELTHLYESLPLEHRDTVVFLGDYIDRGPDSRGVIDYLLTIREHNKQKVVFLRGNHEDMMLSFMGISGHHGNAFLLNGGVATLSSYDISAPAVPSDCQAVLEALPASHVEFLMNLEPWYMTDEFLCVHAGINPERAWNDQIHEELIWIRHNFINSEHPLPLTVLFGHTPMKDVFFDLPYKIGLDTGLVYGNTLSCLETTGRILYQIPRGGRHVSVTDVGRHWNGRP
jgi:serine/threonine protein phosphatase 1